MSQRDQIRADFARPALVWLVFWAFQPLPSFAEWPHLRGPNYDGVCSERNLADAWPKEGPPQLWSRELGQGYSGFIGANGKLYTQKQSLGGQYLVCLDPDTGAMIWEYRYDWAWQPKGAYPGPYATPTAHEGKVYYASTSGLVGCVDAKSGAPGWSVNVREKFAGKGYDFGYAATPLVEDGKVILPVGGPDASLVALHVDDGRTVWSVGSDRASYCPALPITLDERRCVVGYLQNALIIVELASGKLLHRLPLSVGYDEHSAWPIYRAPRLFLAGPFRAQATQLELSSAADEALKSKTTWLTKDMGNDVVSCILYEKHLYGFDLRQLQASKNRASRGIFRCLDWETGKECWSTEEIGHASVLAADGKLFMLNDTGSLILARADPKEYRELARAQLFEGEICWTPPLLMRGRLYVRSPAKLFCLDVRKAATGGPDPITPPRAWRLEPGWLMGHERDFPNDAPTWTEMAGWFLVNLILVFGGAALGMQIARLWIKRAQVAGITFFVLAMILGVFGTSVLGVLVDQCVFTWPASLYVAFHAALYVCAWAERQERKQRARWLARLAVAGFVLAAYAYFEACTIVGMFIAWSFLIGFPFAFPLSMLAVRAAFNGQRAWIICGWTLGAFAAFFWSAQILLLLKTA